MFRGSARAFRSILVCLVLALSGSGVAARQVSATALQTSGPPPISGIASGLEHTCVLIDGAVKCWGTNRFGQVGVSSLTNHPFPVDVTGLPGPVTKITGGADHNCALIQYGTVWCWGMDSFGQLGNGSLVNTPTPVQVSGLTGITDIYSGYIYTCALTTAHTVKCWGDNTYGQLGDGTTIQRLTPVNVIGVSNVIAITASLDHTCALISGGGTVKCWGKNDFGELGNGTTDPISTATDAALPAGTNVTAIAAGGQHTCALTSAGTVLCWGDGAFGQMGNGNKTSRNPTPQVVNGITNAVAISAGGYFDTSRTCVLDTEGGVKCWGSNLLGQMGDGTTTDRSMPVAVSGLSEEAQSVLVGIHHTCALLENNALYCWGSDSSGQLGDGIDSLSMTPVDVTGLQSGVTQVGTGKQNTCAVVNNSVMCWGNNRKYQLGDGTPTNRPAPTPVINLSGTLISAVDSGTDQSCAVIDGGVQCWGDANFSPTHISGLSGGVTSLSVSNLHACAIQNGAAFCWGDNSHGQLGNGSLTSSDMPVAVSQLNSGVQAVAAGEWFSCALLNSGQVRCWGDNTSGQLGNGSYGSTPVTRPVVVKGLNNAVMLATGQAHTCALTGAGAVICWGNNQQGQIGDGTQTTRLAPTQVRGITGGATDITASGLHTCAVVNGAARCWGFNNFGQLGNGQTTSSSVPVYVVGLSNGVTTVVAGGVNYEQEHTCAITSLNGLKCWGGDKFGQLGDNLPILRTTPVRVLGLAAAPEIGTNYTSGRLGSYFRMTVANFPPNTPLILLAGDKVIGGMMTSAEGYAIFQVLADAGVDSVTQITAKSSTTSASTTLAIASDQPQRIMEGKAFVYAFSEKFIYVPVINR
jgi:alpha-tubulin suppressor-like RCC1 family protein